MCPPEHDDDKTVSMAPVKQTELDTVVLDAEKTESSAEAVVCFLSGVASLLRKHAKEPKKLEALADEIEDKMVDIGATMAVDGSSDFPSVAPVFADRAAFDAWLAAFDMGNTVTLDNLQVQAGHGNTLLFYSHSATGVIDTIGPTS